MLEGRKRRGKEQKTHDFDGMTESLLALLVVCLPVDLREPHCAETGNVDGRSGVDLDGARHG